MCVHARMHECICMYGTCAYVHCVYVSTCVCQWMHTCAFGGRRSSLGAHPQEHGPCVWDGLSLGSEAHRWGSTNFPASPSNLPFSTCQDLGLWVCYMGTSAWIKALYLQRSTWLSELSLLPFNFLFMARCLDTCTLMMEVGVCLSCNLLSFSICSLEIFLSNLNFLSPSDKGFYYWFHFYPFYLIVSAFIRIITGTFD